MLGLNAGDVTAYLRMDSSQFDAAIRQSQQRVQQFAQTLGRMGTYLTLRLTLPLTYFAVKATKSFAAFDDAITRSAAVTRGMTREMRKQMEETAMQISKRSILSATDLAEGYFALGQAGYSAAQSISVLPAVEDFAIASTIDLDTSIRYLSRTMEGLAMSSEDPKEMMESMIRVSDAFTFAAITTTAEIQDFAVAMTHAAAPALRLVSKTVEEGISVLMAFARAGIVAEESGTLLWTTVRDLQRASVRFRGEWNRLNIQVYDADKNMRNLADIFEQLEDRFSGMSDEGKKVSLMMLGFQDRSLRGIQALMGFSAEMKIWQKAMEEGGNLTEQVAETYLKSFNAQLLMIRNNLEVLKIRLGWMLSPILSKFREKLEQFVNWWERLSDATKLFIVEVAILLAVVGPLLIVFSKMVATLGFMSIGFGALYSVIAPVVVALGSVTLTVVGILAAIALVIAAAYAFRAAWIQNVKPIRKVLEFFVDWYKTTYGNLVKIIGKFLVWWVESYRSAFNLLRDQWGTYAADTYATIVATWKALERARKGFIKGFLFGGILRDFNAYREAFKKAHIQWSQDFVDAHDKATKRIDEFKDMVLNAYEVTIDILQEWGSAIKEQFGEDLAYVTELIAEKVKKMNESLLKYLPEKDLREIAIALQKASKAAKEFAEQYYGLSIWGRHMEQAMKVTDRFQEVAVRGFETTADALTKFVKTGEMDIKRLAEVILTDLLGALIRLQMARLWTGALVGPVTGAPGGIGGFFGGLGTQLKSWWIGRGGTTGVMGTGPGGSTMPGVAVAQLGKVFDYGRVLPMQFGGVIPNPMLAPINRHQSAYIAEKGPEAVMPLTRTKTGELGVRSEQPQINVDSRTKIVNVMDQGEMLSAMQSDKGERVILNVLRRKGIV